MGVINNSAVSTHRARPTTTKMKALLVIALASLAAAKPQLPLYPYTYPLTNTVPVVTPVAVNTCKNSEGQLVPCASGAGSVYAHADAPGVPIVPGVLNTAGGVSPVLYGMDITDVHGDCTEDIMDITAILSMDTEQDLTKR